VPFSARAHQTVTVKADVSIKTRGKQHLRTTDIIFICQCSQTKPLSADRFACAISPVRAMFIIAVYAVYKMRRELEQLFSNYTTGRAQARPRPQHQQRSFDNFSRQRTDREISKEAFAQSQ
jgi:hypothetical protein